MKNTGRLRREGKRDKGKGERGESLISALLPHRLLKNKKSLPCLTMRERPAVLVTHALMLLLLGLWLPDQARAQAQLSQAFEGKMVTVKIDMPGTQLGADVYPQRPTPLDLKSFARRLKQYGTALRAGDSVMITKVKAKDKLIEVQLGGGGYGTIRDDTNATVIAPPSEESRREKDLKVQLMNESDPAKRRQIQARLNDLRDRREQTDKQNRILAADASAQKAEVISGKRLQGGSRFNLKYTGAVPAEALTPEAVMAALAQYVTFPKESFGSASDQR